MNPEISPQLEANVREAIEAYTDTIEPAPDALDRIRRETKRRARPSVVIGGTLAVAALVAAAVAVFAIVRDEAPKGVNVGPPVSQPDAPTLDALATGEWYVLPDAPLAARSGEAVIWSGSKLMVWGGQDDQGAELSDGAIYDPLSRSWQAAAPSPLAGGNSDGMRLGDEVVVFDDHERAAVYNPATNAWRTIADPPFDTYDMAAVETPGGMFVRIWDDEAAEGASYDARADAWQIVEVPSATVRPPIVVDGSGFTWDGGIEWVMDLDTFEWRQGAAAPSTGNAADDEQRVDPVGLVGREIIVKRGQTALAFDPQTSEYRVLGRALGLETASVVVGEMLLEYGGVPVDGDEAVAAGVALDTVSGRTVSLPASPLGARQEARAVWAGDQFIVWGGGDDGTPRAAALAP